MRVLLVLMLLAGIAQARKGRTLTPEEERLVKARHVAVVRVMKVPDVKSTNAMPPTIVVEVEEVLRGTGGRLTAEWEPPPPNGNDVLTWSRTPLPPPKIGTAMVVVLEEQRDRKWSIPACCRWPYSEERKRWVAEIDALVLPQSAEAARAAEVEAARDEYRDKVARDRKEEQDRLERMKTLERERARQERELREAREAAEQEEATRKQHGVIRENVLRYTKKAEVVVVARRKDSEARKDGGLALELEIVKTLKGDWKGRLLHLEEGVEVAYWNVVAPVTLDRQVIVFARLEDGVWRLVAEDAVVEATDEWIDTARGKR